MPRRFVIASILSVAMAASTATVAGHAQTVAAPSATSAVTQTTPTAQTAAPTFECEPGIVTTICQIIFAPFCTTHVCTVNAQSPSTAAATGSVRTSTSAPTVQCAPDFQVVCTVLGLTVCSIRFCGIDASTPAARTDAAPTIDCAIEVMCTVLGKVCPHCTVSAATSTSTAPALGARRVS